jgi:hypothetical protein
VITLRKHAFNRSKQRKNTAFGHETRQNLLAMRRDCARTQHTLSEWTGSENQLCVEKRHHPPLLGAMLRQRKMFEKSKSEILRTQAWMLIIHPSFSGSKSFSNF